MPGVMAGAGTSSILVLGVISIGALLLAVLFGQLTKRIPSSDGGLYAYARHEFGDFAGYLTAWCYWITAWAGNAAIVSSWVLYVESLFSITHPSAWTNFGIAMCGLWIPAAVNLVGVRQMAWFQNVTVVLKFLPLAVVGIVGWFFVHAANFGPFNATWRQPVQRHRHRCGRRALLLHRRRVCLDRGRSSASNPRKNVGRASVLGTAALRPPLPPRHRRGDGARPPPRRSSATARPFVNAFQTMFSHFSWAGKLVAAVAVVSGIGALNGWTLVTAEMPWAAPKDGLFLPQFAKTYRDGTPWFGILVSTLVASVLMAFAYSGKSGLTVFTYLVDLSVVTVAIPYFFSACAQLAYLVSRRRRVNGWMLARDLAHRVAERAVLALGRLHGRVPVRLPGDAAASRRHPDLRLLEGSPRASRAGSRAGRGGA